MVRLLPLLLKTLGNQIMRLLLELPLLLLLLLQLPLLLLPLLLLGRPLASPAWRLRCFPTEVDTSPIEAPASMPPTILTAEQKRHGNMKAEEKIVPTILMAEEKRHGNKKAEEKIVPTILMVKAKIMSAHQSHVCWF